MPVTLPNLKPLSTNSNSYTMIPAVYKIYKPPPRPPSYIGPVSYKESSASTSKSSGARWSSIPPPPYTPYHDPPKRQRGVHPCASLSLSSWQQRALATMAQLWDRVLHFGQLLLVLFVCVGGLMALVFIAPFVIAMMGALLKMSGLLCLVGGLFFICIPIPGTSLLGVPLFCTGVFLLLLVIVF